MRAKPAGVRGSCVGVGASDTRASHARAGRVSMRASDPRAGRRVRHLVLCRA